MSDPFPIPSKRSFIWKLLATVIGQICGILGKLWLRFANSFKCYNQETLFKLIRKREPGRALITVGNHDSCLDDPLLYCALVPNRYLYAGKYRWSLGAKEICHTGPITTKFFCYGQVIPIIRGAGIYQEAMNFALGELKKGAWLHMFPEGKVNEKHEFIRYKWGVGRLVMELDIPPIVLPIYTIGMDDVLPNKLPYRLQTGHKVTCCVGNPILFDNLLKELREKQKSDEEIRIIITAKIQDEMQILKEICHGYHQKHLKLD